MNNPCAHVRCEITASVADEQGNSTVLEKGCQYTTTRINDAGACRPKSRSIIPRWHHKTKTKTAMLVRAVLLADLVGTALGHGAVTHPKPRQAIDGALLPWCASLSSIGLSVPSLGRRRNP